MVVGEHCSTAELVENLTDSGDGMWSGTGSIHYSDPNVLRSGLAYWDAVGNDPCRRSDQLLPYSAWPNNHS